MGYYKDEKSSNLYNFNNKINNKHKEKLKNVGILYKNNKYYIDENLNYLEIPLINEDNKKKKELNKNMNFDKNEEIIKEKKIWK